MLKHRANPQMNCPGLKTFLKITFLACVKHRGNDSTCGNIVLSRLTRFESEAAEARLPLNLEHAQQELCRP